MTRFPFERHDMQGERVAGEDGFAIPSYKIGAVCQEVLRKSAGSYYGCINDTEGVFDACVFLFGPARGDPCENI